MKMLTKITLLLLCASFAWAQSITGSVIDANTGEPLVGANVVIKGTFKGSTTELDGTFSISNVEGSVTLVVQYVGYRAIERSASAGDDVKFELQEELYGDAVVVSGSRQSESILESAVTIEKLDAVDIKNAPNASFYEALSHMKSVDIVSASVGMKTINLRGFNSTSPDRMLQYVDGMDNQAPALNFPVSNLVGMSELDIESVEMIYGAASSTYGANAFNGVVSMNSKSPWEFPGTSVRVSAGGQAYYEGILRHAQKINDKFAFKVNFSMMQADEWEATDNKYAPLQEKDLTNSQAKNQKISGGLYYLINDKTELSYSINYGTGTTVYQGAQRYNIKDFSMTQQKVELNGKRGDDSYKLKFYHTADDAGDSYNIGLTAGFMLGAGITSTDHPAFQQTFDAITSRPLGVGVAGAGSKLVDKSTFTHYEGQYNMTLNDRMNLIAGASYRNYNPESDGTLFRDQGNVYKDEGDIEVSEMGFFTQLQSKMLNNRLKATISARYDKHENFDGQFSPGIAFVYSFKSNDDRANNGNLRVSYQTAFRNPSLQDQYIGLNVGPARLLSSNFNSLPNMNALLWGNYDGFKSANTAYTAVSALTYAGTWNHVYNLYGGAANHAVAAANAEGAAFPILEEVTAIDAVKPEKVNAWEIGYKSIIGESFFLDVNYYENYYTDFISDKQIIVLRNADGSPGSPGSAGTAVSHQQILQQQADLYLVDSNTDQDVTARGFGLNATYNFGEHYFVRGNHTWAEVAVDEGSTAELGFNTPKNKWNLTFSGRNLNKFGFNINIKHVDGFDWSGSGYDGRVPAYELVDVAVLYDFKISKANMLAKLAISNLLDNKHIEAFGAPEIGRLVMFQLSADL
jgi:outer membrane receptor protein involved in Fe transport